MFTKSELLVRSILGLCQMDIRPMTYAIDVIIELLFVEDVHQGDILVTKDVYPRVARILGKTPAAVARSAERITNLFWEAAKKQERILEFIGKSLYDTPSVFEILCYLAYFAHYREPFFKAFKDFESFDLRDSFFDKKEKISTCAGLMRLSD